MILLYLIGILCTLVLFAPSIVPTFVKWPVALLVVLLVVFFFNLPKKDTVYTTHSNKKRLYDYGLFNPLFFYISAASYILGFTLIFTFLVQHEATDLVAKISEIPSLIEFNFENNLFVGLIFVVAAILIYFLRNIFKNNASASGIKNRSFWYVLLTILALFIGIYNFVSYYTFDIYSYLQIGYNFYVYFGLLALVILIDLIGKWICYGCKKRKERKALEAAKKAEEESRATEPVVEEPVVEEQPVEDVVSEEVAEEAPKSKKELKAEKKAEKRRKRLEKKLAKAEAKLNKKIAKVEAKRAKAEARHQKRINKINK